MSLDALEFRQRGVQQPGSVRDSERYWSDIQAATRQNPSHGTPLQRGLIDLTAAIVCATAALAGSRPDPGRIQAGIRLNTGPCHRCRQFLSKRRILVRGKEALMKMASSFRLGVRADLSFHIMDE